MRILAAHLLGDFLFQNRWLARMKRDSIVGLLIHCAITSLALGIVCGWWDGRLFLAFLSHLLIDRLDLGKRVWPRLLDQGNPDDTEPAPMWICLVDDQALHILSLALIGMLGA